MKILVINPNTSREMTRDIQTSIDQIASPNIRAEVVSPDFGPESLESYYDYHLAAFGVSRLLQQRKKDFDGILIACYGDPGLFAVKEIADCPVIGIAEASLSLSLLMGYKVGILAASNKAIPMMENMVGQYGLASRLAGVWALDMRVLEVEEDKQEAIDRLIQVGGRAKEAGAEVLLLGCAGMTGISDKVEKALGVPIIDPIQSSYKLLELMVQLGYKTSKSGLYSEPPPHAIKNEALLTK